MHIKCHKEDLVNGVNIALKAVSSRTTLPILQCLLLDGSTDVFKCISNDLELGIENKISASIHEKGSIAIKANIFSDIVKKLPNSEVTLKVDDNHLLTIQCENSEFNIPGEPASEFIHLPQITKSSPLKLSQSVLKQIIHQTIFSIALEEIRPILTGELFEIKDNYLNIISIDGYRVSIRKTKLSEDYENLSCVIPGKTLNEIQKILVAEEDQNVVLYFTDKHILFEFNDTIVVSRLLEGDFPNYEQIFSDDYEILVKADCKQLSMSLERAALIAKESKKSPIKLQLQEKTMAITSNTELGKVHEEIAIKKEGADLDIAFNPKYLIDALKVIEDDSIYLQFTTAMNPCIIKDQEKGLYQYLVLPIRING